MKKVKKFKLSKQALEEVTDNNGKYERRMIRCALEALVGLAISAIGISNAMRDPVYGPITGLPGLGMTIDGLVKMYVSYKAREAFKRGELRAPKK